MSSEGWVGLDMGTTSSKAVVYDGSGRMLAQGRAPTRWRTTPQGVEIDGGELLAQAMSALAEAVANTPAGTRLRGVGVTSMGETGVLVDAAGRVVTPSIAWHDTRDDREVALLREQIGDDAFGATAGKPLRGQFSITKHRWLADHEAGAAGAARRRFNVAEWIVRGLGGEEVTDRALAGRTGWFDVEAGDWWDAALDWSGATRDLMPVLVAPGSPCGVVQEGPLTGAVLTTAGHDHQAAALGAGAIHPGDELDSSGTAEALVRIVRPDLTAEQRVRLARRGITTDVSVQPGRWSLLGGTEGGLALQRTLDALGVTREGLADLDRRALSGEAQPWRDAVGRATEEAGALHAAMSAVVGPHSRLIATGGWCHSAMVMDAKRRVFGPLTVSSVAEAGTLGAAILAARAAGALTGDEVLA